MFERKDRFYKQAKKEGHASRAIYKLLEIQKKYRIVRSGNRILELGATPGGWLPQIAEWVGPKGHVFAIDLLPLKILPPANATFFQADFEKMRELLPAQKFNTILSDISPNLSGIRFRDTHLSLEISKNIFSLCPEWLCPGGNLVLKTFPSEETQELRKELKQNFREFKTLIPEATRKESSEVYFIALGYKNG